MLLLLLWSVFAGLLLLLLLHSNAWRLKKKLPPGSMGWPVIGELLTYIPLVRSEQLYRFTQQKAAKYGPVFKTSLLTGSTVMVTDAEGIKTVLQNDSVFRSGYPRSLKNVLGEYAMMFRHGDVHRRMQAMVRRFSNSTSLRKNHTRELELLVMKGMDSWPRKTRFLLADAAQEINHNFLMKQLYGIEPGKLSTVILEEFEKVMAGIIGVPIMIPWTPYYRAMKARSKLIEVMSTMLTSRRAQPGVEYNDIFQTLLEDKQEDEPDEVIYDNALICILNGQGVPAATLALAVKYLADCPEALKQLREENLAIRKGKAKNEGLSWNEYMSLEFTQAVFYETLRVSSAAQGVMRRVREDVEFRGYVIPKGWTVLPYFTNIHFDEKVYKDPYKFHPWRWLEKNIPPGYFLPFGGGTRACPGQELARLQSLIFLHHMVTRFSWKTEKETVIHFPVVRTKNRLPIVVEDL